MKLTQEKRAALAVLAGYAGQLKWAMELDKANSRVGKGGASEPVEQNGDEPEVLYIGREPDDEFRRVLEKFQREACASDLLDSDYSRTVSTLGGGRSGHELAADPSSCDLKLCLAVLTFLLRAERFV
ncbi:MAG: hypothetical protein IKL39_04310, partial [Mailhella sp.]|nr:hypothetical protein [Mailhella sp.]